MKDRSKPDAAEVNCQLHGGLLAQSSDPKEVAFISGLFDPGQYVIAAGTNRADWGKGKHGLKFPVSDKTERLSTGWHAELLIG